MKKGKYVKVDDVTYDSAASLMSLILGAKGELLPPPPPPPSTIIAVFK